MSLRNCSRVLRIAIDNEVALAMHRASQRIGYIARNLEHPRFVRPGRDSCNRYDAVGKTDHEEQVLSDQAPHRPHFHGEEVTGSQDFPVRPEKRRPSACRLLRSGAGSMPLRFNTLAIVPRATLWLRLANAP